jgi:hypothetical protein
VLTTAGNPSKLSQNQGSLGQLEFGFIRLFSVGVRGVARLGMARERMRMRGRMMKMVEACSTFSDKGCNYWTNGFGVKVQWL